MRRFESDYRINEGDDVLDRENAIHQDVDLRLDAVEQDAEAFRAGNRADIEAILKSLEQTFGTLAAEMRGLLDQTVGGLSADIVVETSARYFLTDARRAAILSDLRGGVDASGDTLAKLLALIVGVVGGAPTGRQSLKAINDAVVANTATLSAITSGADPTLDSFAEALTRFVIDEGQISSLMTMVGNRLRGDAPGGYSAGFQDQLRANIGGGLLTTLASSAPLSTLDIGRPVDATGVITITMPNGGTGWFSGPIANRNLITGLVTLAVPAGATLDGVANGTTVLKSYQRARIRQIGAAAYRTEWEDRSPIIATRPIAAPASSIILPLPVGYGDFELSIAGLRVSAATALNAVISLDGGNTFQSGAGLYLNDLLFGSSANSSGTPGAAATGDPGMTLAASIAAGALGFTGQGLIGPGSSSSQPSLLMKAGHYNGSTYVVRLTHSVFTAAGLANALQIITPSANMIEGFISIRGVA